MLIVREEENGYSVYYKIGKFREMKTLHEALKMKKKLALKLKTNPFHGQTQNDFNQWIEQHFSPDLL